MLRSERAVKVNIEIMRAFVCLRKVLAANAELAQRLAELEQLIGEHDEQLVEVGSPCQPPRGTCHERESVQSATHNYYYIYTCQRVGDLVITLRKQS